MSNSKERRAGNEEEKGWGPETKTTRRCVRCRNHGVSAHRKGHARLCPFADCGCKRCGAVMQRRGAAALSRCPKRGPGNPQGPAAASQGFPGGFGPPNPTAFGPHPAAFGPPHLAAFGPPNPAAFGPPHPAAFGPPNPAAFGPPHPAAFGPPHSAAFGPPNPGAFGPPNPGAFGPPNPAAFGPPILVVSAATAASPSTAADSTSTPPPNISSPADSPSRGGCHGPGGDSGSNYDSCDFGPMGRIPFIRNPFVEVEDPKPLSVRGWQCLARLVRWHRAQAGASGNGPPTIPPPQQGPLGPPGSPGPPGPPGPLGPRPASHWIQFLLGFAPSPPTGPPGGPPHPQPTPPQNNPGT